MTQSKTQSFVSASIPASSDHVRFLLTLLKGQTTCSQVHPCMPCQRVADHSWYVAVILVLVDPNCSVDHLKTALLHTVPELIHDDISALVKHSTLMPDDLRTKFETETLCSQTSHEEEPTHAIKIAERLADLWQFALQSRYGNREATLGFTNHLKWLDELDLTEFPNAVAVHDAIERWCLYGSMVLTEEIS